MKLAIIGSRGFLTHYGGYETFVKKLALSLSEKDVFVIVYGMANYRNSDNDKYFPAVKRIWISTLHVRFLEKVLSSLLAVLHVCFSDTDIILSISVSSGLLLFLPCLLGKQVVVNPDGLEWKRPKWSKFINFFLRLSEWMAVNFSNIVVADSQVIKEYIVNKYKKRTIFIPYGAEINGYSDNDAEVLAKYKLRPKQYYLQVCRLEPENNSHLIIKEFVDYKGGKKLIIVGDTPHSIEYKKNLEKEGNHKVRFLGSVYGADHKVILRNAYCYIHGHEAGGTNPSLLEAMASARCPVVLNVPYNLEVVGDCGLSFSKNRGDLAEKLSFLDSNENLVKSLGDRALVRVKKHYTWEKVISDYDIVFRSLVR